MITEQQGSKEALLLGQNSKANLVLWGWYGVTATDVLLSANLENLSGPEGIPLLNSGRYKSQASAAELDRFSFQANLSKEITALMLFITAVVRCEAEDYGEAKKRVDEAFAFGSWPEPLINRAVLFFVRGQATLMTGDVQPAYDDFSMAIKLDPGFPKSYANRCAACTILGRSKDGIDDFRALDGYGLRHLALARPALMPLMRFLFIGSHLCSTLPSNLASRQCPCVCYPSPPSG